VGSLEQFARIRAAIEQGGDRRQVLREAGLAPAAWIDLQRRWLDALAAEVAIGGDTLAARYLAAFEAARAPAPAGEEPGEPAEEAAPAAVAPAGPRPAEDAVHVPSYLKTPAAPLPVAPAPAPPQAGLRGTALAFEVPQGPAMPFREGPPPAVAASSSGPKGAPSISGGTALAIEAPRGSSMPFHAEGERSPAPAAGADPEAMGFDLPRYAELVAARSAPGADLAAVLAEIGIDAAVHERVEAYWRRKFSENGMLALDFERLVVRARSSRAAVGPVAAGPPAGAFLRPAEPSPKRAPVGSGTALVLDVKPAPATPFQPALGAPEVPRPATPAAPPAGSGTSLAVEVPHDALPFAAAPPPAAPPPVPELTVEQYAWVVASLRKATDVAAALARFRLTPESRRELEARWAKRMAADEALREAFLAALGRHLAAGGG
jgi:hypothetical protein